MHRSVAFTQAHGKTNKEGVVENIVVRQRGAFRCARGAAGELDVDFISDIEVGLIIARRRERPSTWPAEATSGKTNHAGLASPRPG